MTLRAVIAQALRDQAGLVTQVVDDGLDPGGGGGGHTVTAVDDFGDGGDRNASLGGDVTDGDPGGGVHAGRIAL